MNSFQKLYYYYQLIRKKSSDLSIVNFQETNSVTDYAICVCKFDKAVCGEDGKTYKNRCEFEETMAGRSERFRIVRDEPCDEGIHIQTFKIKVSQNSSDKLVYADE